MVCIAFAATSYSQDIKFGVKSGLNLSTMVGDDVSDVDSKIDFYVGTFVNIPITQSFSFQPEVIYSREGSKSDYDGTDVDLNADYLNMPLLFKFSAKKLSIYVGPQIGYLLKAEVEGEVEGMTASMDIKDEMEAAVFSFNVGACYNLSDNLALDLRYNRGLSSMAIDGDLYGSTIQLGASYKF